jgi:hypothetical protein
MHEDTDDSRTSAVGRKRNLGEIHDQDSSTSRHSSPEDDAQRAPKRVKEDDELLEDSIVGDGIILNSSSPLRLASPPLPTEFSQTLPTTSQTPPIIAALPRAGGAWNRGVQSGVRTSFGSRAQVRPKSKSKSIIPSSQNGADTPSNAITDARDLSQKYTSISPDQDEGADSTMAETPDQPEMQTSVPPSLDGGEDVLMAEKDIPEMQTATTSEEEGEIPSSRSNGNDVDMLREQVSRQYASGRGSFLKGAAGNGNSLQLQAPRLFERDDSQPAGNVFGVDLEPRETAVRHSSSSPLDEDMEDPSDADAAEADTSPVRQAVNPPFTILSDAEEAQLTVAEKTRYLKAKNDWIKLERHQNTLSEKKKSFNRLTTEAESIFSHERLPLPSKYSAVEENISAGLTFFPRKVVQNGPFYQKKNIDYTASEVLNDGKPIRIQDLTIDIFAPSFLKDNPDKWDYIKPKMLLSAFKIYRTTFYSGNAIALGSPNAINNSLDFGSKMIKQAQKKAKILLASLPPKESTPDLPDNDDELLPDHSTEIDINQANIDEMERKLQQKYFPSANDRPATYHCLTCGDNSHMTMDCSSLTCTLCGGDHVQFACPQSRRCHKCRQRGHDVAECPEKLALSKAESIGCDFCGSTDHFEINCHTIWRTFHPKPQEIRKVREIPVHCYICGGTGHYGPECGLYKEYPLLSGGQTWSKETLLKFIDTASADRAMSAGIDYSIPSKSVKEFTIKGKANDPINLDDSDDEDISFLHKKVKGPKHHAQIKIAGTARLGKLPQEAGFSRAPNPPRDARPDFRRNVGHDVPPGVDSARYGRKRTFSPPLRFDDMRYSFPEAEDHYRLQATQRENSYRPRPAQAQNNHQSAPQGSLPVRPPTGNNSRGGHAGQGGRAQNGGGNNIQGRTARGGKEKRRKRSDRGGAASRGSRGN